MKTKLEHPKCKDNLPEALETQELLELARKLDLRRKQEKKSLWRRIFDPKLRKSRKNRQVVKFGVDMKMTMV